MFTKSDQKKWIKEIDESITVFPENVISSLITSYIPLAPFFEPEMKSCSCSRRCLHNNMNIKNYLKVEHTEIKVKRFSEPWIYYPLETHMQGEFKIMFKITGLVLLLLTTTKPGKKIEKKAASCLCSLSRPEILVEHRINSPNRNIIIVIGQKFDSYDALTIIDPEGPYDPENTYWLQENILTKSIIYFGVGYLPTTIEILNVPQDSDPIWQIYKYFKNVEKQKLRMQIVRK